MSKLIKKKLRGIRKGNNVIEKPADDGPVSLNVVGQDCVVVVRPEENQLAEGVLTEVLENKDQLLRQQAEEIFELQKKLEHFQQHTDPTPDDIRYSYDKAVKENLTLKEELEDMKKLFNVDPEHISEDTNIGVLVSQLRGRILSLEKINNEIKEHVKNQSRTIQELKQTQKEVCAENERLVAQVDAEQAKAMIYQLDFTEERKDREAAHSKFADAERMMAKLKSDHAEEVRKLTEQLEHHKKLMADVEGVKEAWEGEANQKQDEIQAKISQVKAYKKQVDQLKAKVEEQEQEIAGLNKEVSQKSKELKKALEKAKTNSHSNKKSQQTKKASTGKLPLTPEEFEHQLAKAEKLRFENEEIRDELTQKDRVIKDLRKVIKDSEPPLRAKDPSSTPNHLTPSSQRRLHKSMPERVPNQILQEEQRPRSGSFTEQCILERQTRPPNILRGNVRDEDYSNERFMNENNYYLPARSHEAAYNPGTPFIPSNSHLAAEANYPPTSNMHSPTVHSSQPEYNRGHSPFIATHNPSYDGTSKPQPYYEQNPAIQQQYWPPHAQPAQQYLSREPHSRFEQRPPPHQPQVPMNHSVHPFQHVEQHHLMPVYKEHSPMHEQRQQVAQPPQHHHDQSHHSHEQTNFPVAARPDLYINLHVGRQSSPGIKSYESTPSDASTPFSQTSGNSDTHLSPKPSKPSPKPRKLQPNFAQASPRSDTPSKQLTETDDTRTRSDTLMRIKPNVLQESIDKDISEAAAEVSEVTRSEGEREGAPLDPNLICQMCLKQYRIGEIQLYRVHVSKCDGTKH